jgi:hypothetical protein
MTRPDVFGKRSDDPRTGTALRTEAEMLIVAAHPGVVEVLRSESSGAGWELDLRRVNGSDLTRQPSWTPEELAGFGAAAATTLADLHDLEIVHGRVGPEHLLVDESGRPVFCGFGHARRCHGDPAGGDRKAADVADLARCLAARLPAGAPRALHHALARAMHGGGRRRPLTARQFARVLGQSVACAVLPAPLEASEVMQESGREGAGATAQTAGPEEGNDEDNQWPATGPTTAVRAVLVGLVLAGLAAGAFVVTTSPRRGHLPSATPASTPSPHRIAPGIACPAMDDRCRPVATPGGVLTLARGRYRIGQSGDVVVVGRWTCSSEAFPALLRPATGQVWAFGRWANPGKDATATLLGRVVDASTLRVLPGRDGCDRVEVLRREGRPVTVSWPRPPAPLGPGVGGVGSRR